MLESSLYRRRRVVLYVLCRVRLVFGIFSGTACRRLTEFMQLLLLVVLGEFNRVFFRIIKPSQSLWHDWPAQFGL